MLDMIQCTSGGAYYARGEWVPADENAGQVLASKGFDAAAAAQAQKGTMAYGILSAHNHSGDDDALQLKFDAMASHDITFVGIIQTARASGLSVSRFRMCSPTATTACVQWGGRSMRTTTGLVCPPLKNTAGSLFRPIWR